MKPIRKNTEEMRQLGAAVKRRREALRLTQPEVVRLSGCSLDFVVDLEKGRASRLDRIFAVLRVLGVGFVLTQSPASFEISVELR